MKRIEMTFEFLTPKTNPETFTVGVDITADEGVVIHRLLEAACIDLENGFEPVARLMHRREMEIHQ